MEKFHGSIAVVTGASSGIGLGIVKKLLETKELEVIGLSRREMTLAEPNFRNLFKILAKNVVDPNRIFNALYDMGRIEENLKLVQM